MCASASTNLPYVPIARSIVTATFGLLMFYRESAILICRNDALACWCCCCTHEYRMLHLWLWSRSLQKLLALVVRLYHIGVLTNCSAVMQLWTSLLLPNGCSCFNTVITTRKRQKFALRLKLFFTSLRFTSFFVICSPRSTQILCRIRVYGPDLRHPNAT